MPPKGSKNTSHNMTKDACCSWTDADDVILVHILKEQKDAGNQSGAGWKSQVWTLVKATLKSEGIPKGGPKIARQQLHLQRWYRVGGLFGGFPWLTASNDVYG